MLKAIIFDFLGVLYSVQGEAPGELNHDLLDFITTLRTEVDVYIFTTETLLMERQVQEIEPIFTGTFRAKDLGIKKNSPESYELIAEKLAAKTDEIIFFDDSQENVDAAASAGIRAYRFESNFETIRTINRNF